jgi:hypothetical protein
MNQLYLEVAGEASGAASGEASGETLAPRPAAREASLLVILSLFPGDVFSSALAARLALFAAPHPPDRDLHIGSDFSKRLALTEFLHNRVTINLFRGIDGRNHSRNRQCYPKHYRSGDDRKFAHE